MAFVTGNDSQTHMFIPISDNPLHLASSSEKPLFLPDLSPLSSLRTSQRKSSLKSLKDDTSSTKHTVKWLHPISVSRMIAGMESSDTHLKDIPQITSPWSMSQSLSPNESSQSENMTLVELDHHFSQSPHGRKRVLSFSRPKALLSWPEELQARMNLMHLHEVVLPKILTLSISIHNSNHGTIPNVSKRPFSKASAKPSRRNIINNQDVFKPATSINIPSLSRSSQNDSPPVPRPHKRRPTTPDPNKRPKKAPRTDENIGSFRDTDEPVSDVEGFPGFKLVESQLDQLIGSSADKPVETLPSAELDDENSSDDDEALSDEESLFGDSESEHEGNVKGSQAGNANTQTQRPRRPLNSIKVVTWTNGLKRFDYLLQNKKMDWRCDDELYELLKVIDVEKDNVTIELLKKTQVGKMVKGLSKCDKFEERSRILAKKIYRSWLEMCRAIALE